MKRLTNAQVAKKQRLSTQLTEAATALLAAQEDYNEVAQAINDFATEIVDEARAYYDERSEKWQESDAGGNYDVWVQDWEAVDIELVDAIDDSLRTENPLHDTTDAPE